MDRIYNTFRCHSCWFALSCFLSFYKLPLDCFLSDDQCWWRRKWAFARRKFRPVRLGIHRTFVPSQENHLTAHAIWRGDPSKREQSSLGYCSLLVSSSNFGGNQLLLEPRFTGNYFVASPKIAFPGACSPTTPAASPLRYSCAVMVVRIFCPVRVTLQFWVLGTEGPNCCHV